MAEAFIVRRGGGGSGGTLVVTSTGAGTITVSNSTLGKSYSKTVTANGSVTFKGLKTGTWTVKLSNGTQTTTETVTINADYSVSVAYFSATIKVVSYPPKSNCTIKDNSSGKIVASDTNAGNYTKTWTATVNARGTYTVTITAIDDSSKTKSTTVSITDPGQSESVMLKFELVLFDNGKGVTWSAVSNASYCKIGTTLGFTEVTDRESDVTLSISTREKVDLSDYSTLYFNVVSAGAIVRASFGASSSQSSVGGAAKTSGVSAIGTISVDISNLTSSDKYYVNFGTWGYSNSTEMTINKVWAV